MMNEDNETALDHFFNALGHLWDHSNAKAQEREAAREERSNRRASTGAKRTASALNGDGSCCIAKRKRFKFK